jgi:hypothetical protein
MYPDSVRSARSSGPPAPESDARIAGQRAGLCAGGEPEAQDHRAVTRPGVFAAVVHLDLSIRAGLRGIVGVRDGWNHNGRNHRRECRQ